MTKTKEKKNKKKYKNKPISVQEATQKVNYIVENFDFHKVLSVMRSLKWQYFDFLKGGYYSPEISHLKETAKYLLTSVATGKATVMATGGFMAERHQDGFLHLMFYITEQGSSFWEDENNPETMLELMEELENRKLIETR